MPSTEDAHLQTLSKDETTTAPVSRTLQEPGADITISGLTWPKLLSIIGASLAAMAGIIWILLGIVLADITARIDDKYTQLDTKLDEVSKQIESAISDLGKRTDSLSTKFDAFDNTFRTIYVTDLSSAKVGVAVIQSKLGSLEKLRSLQ